MDKLYQFFILLAILLLGLFVDFQNAEAIQEFERDKLNF